MLTALTGTPGTGKTEVASGLERVGYNVVPLAELVHRAPALGTFNDRRQSWEVDLSAVEESLPSTRPLVVEGHLSHLLPVDQAIVLRCHPDVLRRRLSVRGWSSAKVTENVEAEALGVIVQEVRDVPTFEVDTSSSPRPAIVRSVIEILEGRGDAYRAGGVDWSEVILSWY